ncbi:MAG: DUF2809 domain-containing protein [Bacteroidota bacterium]
MSKTTSGASTKAHINRNRLLYLFLIAFTIFIGLFSRADFIPALIYPYLGDALYTLMIYWVVGFLFPHMSPAKVALISILFCYLIEVSQLYKADWIVEIRRTRLGRLTLGSGFLWRDLFSYFLGGMFGFGVEWGMIRGQRS